MKIIYRNVITLSTCIILCFVITSTSAVADNKESYFAEKSITMYTEMSKTIKIMDASSKVKWSSSNKKIASVLGVRGKNSNTVTILSGNKSGTCTIKAKVGKTSYTYKITVKEPINIFKPTVTKVTQTKKSVKIKVMLRNNSSKSLEIGEAFWVEKFTNGKWGKLKMKDGEFAFKMPAYFLSPKASETKTYSISFLYNMKNLTKGTYRIHIKSDYKDAYNYVIFKLK